MRSNKISFILALFFIISCASTEPSFSAEDFKCYPKMVYLIRHAEKQKIKGNENPELTRKGFARSEVLADSLGYLIEGIIYSSEFARSQQTVSPLSERWNADIKIHRASDPDGQVEKALQHCGKIVIISGHSNTVPTLINLFGIKDEITIDDNQYGDLFMISWENSLPILTVTHVGD